jgi:hypothetical protein
MSDSSSNHAYCGIHGGFYPVGSACPNCGPKAVITPAVPSYGYCARHGNAYAGGPCIECAAEQQPTDDTLARFSTHHALWRGARHDIEQLQAAEDRQDVALTQLESDVADINKLYDQVAEIQRQLTALSDKVTQLLRDQSRFAA